MLAVLCFEGELSRTANVNPSRKRSESGKDKAPLYNSR